MQAHADAPLELWSLAYQYAAQIDNMLCQPAIQSDVPASRMFGTTIMNVDHFKVFGCDAYALIEEGKRGKLQSTAIPGIFVGWSRQYNAYKILLPKTLEVIISRNVKLMKPVLTIYRKSNLQLWKPLKIEWFLMKIQIQNMLWSLLKTHVSAMVKPNT